MSVYFLHLCWKNIWRNKRRTLITANAIGFGVMALVAIHNYYDAFHDQVVSNVIRYRSGHLTVASKRYLESQMPNEYLRDVRSVERWLSQREEVKAHAPRVLVQGLLSSAKGSANILFNGVDPSNESRVTSFSQNIIEGVYFGRKRSKPIVLGVGISRLLNVKLGSKVVALTQGVDGSIGNELFVVSGIFETQSEMDKSFAFIRIEDARQLLSLPRAAVHQVAIVLKKDKSLGTVQSAFQSAFPAQKFTMVSWMQLQRPLMALIELNKSANRVLMFVILFIAALGIANSILMSILERTRELGVMMAIGTTRKEIIRMVVMETMLLGGVGVCLGNALGIGLTLYFNKEGFDLRWLTSHAIVVQGTVIQTVSHPEVVWMNSVVTSGVVILLSLIVSIVPARYVSRLNAVQALKTH